MISEHATEFAGLKVVDYERGGTLHDLESTAYALRVDYDDDHSATDLLRELLADAGADRLQGVVVGVWAGEMYDVSSAEIVEVLTAAAPQLVSLRALFLGDVISEENEISWIKQSDLSPLWNAYPKLEHLLVRGSEGLSLGKIDLPFLKSLIIECGGLPKNVLADIAGANLPELEHLELYLGTGEYGADSSIDDVRLLLAGDRFPKLTHLGLRDSEMADEVAQAVAGSTILKQIKVLDLSLGTLGDVGGRALLECPDLKNLEKLDLHRHYLSEELMSQLQALPIEVDVSQRETDEEYGRYVAVGE